MWKKRLASLKILFCVEVVLLLTLIFLPSNSKTLYGWILALVAIPVAAIIYIFEKPKPPPIDAKKGENDDI